jgi:Mrp family chromosome partitioning ATPase
MERARSPLTPGTAELLSRSATPAEAIRSVWRPAQQDKGEVSFLPSGQISSEATELLSSNVLGEFLHRARLRYDITLIDTPPLMAVSDAATIAQHVDGVLMVTAYGETDRFAIIETIKRLRRANGHLLGVILNRVPVGRRGYYHSYYAYKSYDTRV